MRSPAAGMASLLLVAVLAGYAGGWIPAFEIASAFRLHLAMLAGGVGAVFGLLKLWRSAIVAVIALLIAVAGLGPVLAPAQPAGRAAADSDRVLSMLYANLWDLNPLPEATVASLRLIDADILITSETTGAIAGGLRGHYPFRQINPAAGAALRTAIWSKFPLSGGRLYLDNTVAPTAASAVADLGSGVRLGLIGAHFSRPHEGLRQVQAEALGPMADELRQSGPAPALVIAGDFNAPPWSWLVTRAIEITGTRMIGGHRITWKGSYPTPFGPLPEPWGHQIDHLLLSDGIIVEAVDTVVLPGSDHRGLFARLRIPAP
jgi:endonuclease/exonuclease/phosphatase (EEP) superfamily protein YafD